MSIFYLTLPSSDTPDFSYDVDLDGKEYKLQFVYRTRLKCWHLSLYNLAGELLLSNARLVPWLSLTFPFAASTVLPAGNLMLIPKSTNYPSSPEITLENLSTDFILYYLSVVE